jgi:hypothetical protein
LENSERSGIPDLAREEGPSVLEEKHEDSGFKIVDRRTFTVDGTRREGAPRDEEKSADSRKTKSEPAKTPFDERLDEGFAMLIEFLANTALIHLGAMGAAAGEPVPVDLESARAMIDLLGVVEDKTKGNLSAPERKLMSDMLFELHTRFVEVQKRATAKRR